VARRAVSPRLVVATLVVACWVAGLVPAASAVTTPDAPADGGYDAPVVADPRLSPELAGIAVDGDDYQRARANYLATRDRFDQANGRLAGAEQALVDLAAADARLVGVGNEATRRRDKATILLDALRSSMQGIAVENYVRGGVGAPLDPRLDLDSVTAQRRNRVLVDTVNERQLSELRRTRRAIDEAEATIQTSTAELADVRVRTATTTTERAQAAADVDTIGRELEKLPRTVGDARLVSKVRGQDFQLVALDAYVKAAGVLAAEKPTCGLRWQALAAIGRTESLHGTYQGRSFGADGTESAPIYGIALDGSQGTAVVADTDGGRLDGDPNIDRAVGPMQFIPSGWEALGRDGNGDKVADPQNIYDAALTAAVLLCRSGPGLDSDEGLSRAFLRYNQSQAYVDLVLGRTKGYDRFALPGQPPAG